MFPLNLASDIIPDAPNGGRFYPNDELYVSRVIAGGPGRFGGKCLWQFNVRNLLNPEDGSMYAYETLEDDDTKFFEDGVIYNADGSVADNTLLNRFLLFHAVRHGSLDKMIRQPEPYVINNFLYSLPAGNLANLELIASVRDRLDVPVWVSLLIVGNIVDEDAVCTLLTELPNLFSFYSAEWIFHILGINKEDINTFGGFVAPGRREPSTIWTDKFKTFCKVIALENQYYSVNNCS